MEYVTLNNGIKMPKLGYGVYQTPPQDTRRCVLDAIEVGYRSIDTAQAYGNEEGVGAALAECGLPREEFFLTTKVWISNAGYEKAKASIEESMRKLHTDYLDLLLIHQPFGDYYGTYRAMEEFYRAGRIRALGVSNFGPDRYLDIQHFAAVKPAVNQIETHVFQQQKLAKEYLKKYGCQIESWGPFAEGRREMFTNPTLTAIVPNTARPLPRPPCASCCRAMWSSSRSRSTKSGCSRTSTCSISPSPPKIWLPLKLWTAEKACSSPTTTPRRSSGSCPSSDPFCKSNSGLQVLLPCRPLFFCLTLPRRTAFPSSCGYRTAGGPAPGCPAAYSGHCTSGLRGHRG